MAQSQKVRVSKVDKNIVKRIFGRIVTVCQSAQSSDFMGNAAKQLLQVRAKFAIGKSQPKDYNWISVLSSAQVTIDGEKKDGISPADFLKWLSQSGDVESGKVVLAYLVANLGNDVAKRAMLTVQCIQEALAETGLTYTQLVETLGIAPSAGDNARCYTQAYFDAWLVICDEMSKTMSGEFEYTCLRDIFSKTGKHPTEDTSVKLNI